MNFECNLLSAKLLLVDNDLFLIEVLKKHLMNEGLREFQSTTNIDNARSLITNFQADILLLNAILPDGSGMELCSYLRQAGFEKPIIMLIENHNQNHSIDGLNAGANDYITKPIRINDLFSRINFQLRQYNLNVSDRLLVGSLEFAPTKKELSLLGKSKKLLLTEKETLILNILFQSFPGPVAKEVLLREVWGFEADLSTHTLETHIYRLRLKIKNLTKKTLILTTKNGYVLISE